MSTPPAFTTPQDVLDFWNEAGPDAWFAKNDAFDLRFRELFLEAHYAAARRELDHWNETPQGALALIILLDQLPRNAFRDTAHMFATDSLALRFCHEAVARGDDVSVGDTLRPFVLMPLMHSESLTDQERLLEILGEDGAPETVKFAIIHRDIIARFGRFPHRNPALGRETTPEEQAFLDDGGFHG